MEDACVILRGERPAGAAFAASGYQSVLDFLRSLRFCPDMSVKNVAVSLSNDKGTAGVFIYGLGKHGNSDVKVHIAAKLARKREEAREAGSFAHLLHALPSCTSHLFIDDPELNTEELSALCNAIGSRDSTVESLYIYGIRIASSGWSIINDALLSNTSLRFLCLCSSEFWLLLPLRSRTACHIDSLMLYLAKSKVEGDFKGVEELTQLLTALADNSLSLRSLCIFHERYFGFFHQNIFSNDSFYNVLGSNTSLEVLDVECGRLPSKDFRMLFTSLEKNAHLTHLRLKCERDEASDWPDSSFVLDSLRVNRTISYLDLQVNVVEPVKNEPAIEAQLAKNRKRVEELAALKAEGSLLVPPTAVRLFLCGLPFSGKTTLTRSLVRWNISASTSGTSSSAKCFPCACVNLTSMPSRTRGIEVSSIEKDGHRVSLWDMAGQAEYYAFHDQMFPDLSSDAIPSLFLFVWNPFQVHKISGKEMKDEEGRRIVKTEHMFDQEFRYWLRFIASKTLTSHRFKPKLLVAITRSDVLRFNIKNQITSIFKICQNDFRKHIDFDMESGVFVINARDPADVEGLALSIFHGAASVLKPDFSVYQACDKVRRILAELVQSKQLAPLITQREFGSLCTEYLGFHNKEMQKAVARSLNESGDLIYFNELDLVVVDNQWFCHHFMGDLLYFHISDYKHDGFFSPEFLEDLLKPKVYSARLSKHRTKYAKGKDIPTIKGESLVELLIGLQLACQQQRDDDQVTSDIFIPSSLCTTPRKQVDPYRYLNGGENVVQTFMGRRLKCLDSICTFFTPGIFTLLQVAFQHFFKGIHVTLHEDVIAFSRDGVRVLVEFCKHEGHDHFIDVLIHSLLDLDTTIAWAYDEILHKMVRICAEPKGIQGVHLTFHVISPRSVQDCDNMEKRLHAAVPVEELHHTLCRSLEKRGFQPDFQVGSVLHTWQLETKIADPVIDLLGKRETMKIMDEYRQDLILDVQDTLGIDAEELKICTMSEPEKRVFSSSVSGIERGLIYNEIKGARKDIQELRNEIQKLGDEVRILGQRIMPEILQKVQELFTFVKDGEVGRLPRLFVVTRNDTGLVRKILGAMVSGLHNVRLELLCEYQKRPHLVPDQQGITFATVDGLLKQGLPYINLFLKLASLSVKVGAHVAAGLGDSVPDFSQLLALVVDTHEFPSLPTILSDPQTPFASGTSRRNFQEGQQWLMEVLTKYNCCSSTSIHRVFGLSRVVYRGSRVGWLCDKHCSVGELCPLV